MTSIYRSPEGERLLKDAYGRMLSLWPVPHETLRVPTRQGETFVVACGEAGRPALILLHGAASNAAAWLGDVAVWAATHRVFAVDIVGEPGFSAASRPDTTGPAYAEWLDEVQDGLGVGRAAFGGMSMGGWIALDYAIRRPRRVEKLVLIAPGGLGRTRLGFRLRGLVLRIGGSWGRERLLAAIGRTGMPAQVVDYLRLIFTHFRPRAGGFRPFPDAALRQLAMPILLIVGARDEAIDSADSRRRLSRAVPQAEIVELPEAGHVVTGQAERIAAFLIEGATT
ncbi:MAG: alpha/beta fold hydrolase [Phenylobacterium sp.]|uniref:alpha/beta fold hydrolase n=1 Tax=Phenylobacterium sp. TaxID=1871053 RepID=UPI00391D0317